MSIEETSQVQRDRINFISKLPKRLIALSEECKDERMALLLRALSLEARIIVDDWWTIN